MSFSRDTLRSPLVVLLLLWAGLLVRLDAPWWGLGDENGAWISAVVRSYQLYGAAELKFLQVKNLGPASPETYEIYTHHPPLVSWTAALGAALFGFHEASLRFVTACATLLSAAAFYALCRRLSGQRQALWALGFYAFTPMMLYYGRMPDHEALSLLFALMFLAALVRWLRRPGRSQWIGLALLAWLTAWTAWGGLFFVGAGLAWGFARHPALRRPALALALAMAAAVLILLAYYQLAWPGTLDDLIAVFFHRVSSQSGSRGTEDFTWIEYLVRQVGHILPLMTPSLLILAGAGLVDLLRRSPQAESEYPEARVTLAKGMALVLFGAALAYLLAFRNASYIHDYYKIYLSPALAFAASFAAVRWQQGRFAQPALVGLLIAWVVTGGFFFALLHQSSERPFLDAMTWTIQQETAPEDVILTNSDYGIPAVAFYSFRDIRRGVSPEAALNIAARAETRVFYIYCAADARLPAALAAYDYTTEDPCLYLWLS